MTTMAMFEEALLWSRDCLPHWQGSCLFWLTLLLKVVCYSSMIFCSQPSSMKYLQMMSSELKNVASIYQRSCWCGAWKAVLPWDHLQLIIIYLKPRASLKRLGLASHRSYVCLVQHFRQICSYLTSSKLQLSHTAMKLLYLKFCYVLSRKYAFFNLIIWSIQWSGSELY